MANTFPPFFRLKLKSGDREITLKYMPVDSGTSIGTEIKRESFHGTARVGLKGIRFIKDGAQFIREEIHNLGSKAKIFFPIDILDKKTIKYKKYFTAQIDNKKIVDYRDNVENYVECSLLNKGIESSSVALSKVTYDVPLDEIINVIEPANAIENIEYSLTGDSDTGNHIDYYPAMTITEGNIASRDIAFLNVMEGSGDPFLKKIKTRQWDHSIKIHFDVIVGIFTTQQNPITANLTFLVDSNTENIRSETKTVVNDDRGGTVDVRFNEIVEITLNEINSYRFHIKVDIVQGDSRFARIIVINGRDSMNNQVTSTVKSEFIGSSITNPYSFKAISAFNMFQFLLEKVSDGNEYTFSSNLLTDGRLKDIYLTSGDAIRNTENAVIKTNYSDFLNSINCITPITENILDNHVSIESVEEAYRRDDFVYDFGVTNGVQIEPLDNRASAFFGQFTNVIIGSTYKEYQQVNGKFEFNVETEYTTGILDEERSILNLVSKYRTDSFGVHAIRYDFEKSTSKDSKTDNNIFMIHTKKIQENGEIKIIPYTDHEILGDETQKQRTGLFNIYLTPKRCLERWEPVLAANMWSETLLTFTSASKSDTRLTSRLLGEYEELQAVEEQSDMIVDLSKRIISPQIATIKTVAPMFLINMFASQMLGYLSFRLEGKLYKGFLIKGSELPADKRQQELLLYIHPDTPINLPYKNPVGFMGSLRKKYPILFDSFSYKV